MSKSTRPVADPTEKVMVIPVADVGPATTALREVPYVVGVEAQLTEPGPVHWRGQPPPTAARPIPPVEACTRYDRALVADVSFHPVLAAVHLAFNDHRPLVLSPDMVWLLVAQGFANHVNANAEALRPRLVQHPEKLTIEVRRDDFVKGSPANPWPEVFGEFSRGIREHLGAATHDLLLPDFSTTGVAETAAAEVVLLDAMQSFFCYHVMSLCGIPEVVLEGTPEDWALVAERTSRLGLFGLEWWTGTLEPILAEFVAASRGHANARFWRSIYKRDGSSGGPYSTGWITAFFPYLKDSHSGRASRPSPWLTAGGPQLQDLLFPPETDRPAGAFIRGLTTEDFPSGLASAPFRWTYLRHCLAMEFLGGFVGVHQQPGTLRLRPEVGWAVRERASV